MKTKQELREKYREVRSRIQDRDKREKKLIKKLRELEEFEDSSSFLLYRGVNDELKTENIFKWLWGRQKRIYAPFLKQMKIGEVKSMKDFINMNGFYVPKKESKNVQEIDVSIIPGLSFDEYGNRLGYGSGWYDRILKQYKVDYKIGICYREQVSDSLPKEEHDVVMDKLIYV